MYKFIGVTYPLQKVHGTVKCFWHCSVWYWM